MTTVAQTSTIHEVQGGGLRLHVREWGNPDEPPVVFIHGLSQSHLCWARQYQSSLANEFRLVAYDLRGHGMSQAPLEPEHYTDATLWADDLAAIIDQLGSTGPYWSAGPTAALSSATTCAPTVRTASAPSTWSAGSSRWARRRSAP
jgi:alpha-beta hydrolase superfamily lysophospholipase